MNTLSFGFFLAHFWVIEFFNIFPIHSNVEISEQSKIRELPFCFFENSLVRIRAVSITEFPNFSIKRFSKFVLFRGGKIRHHAEQSTGSSIVHAQYGNGHAVEKLTENYRGERTFKEGSVRQGTADRNAEREDCRSAEQKSKVGKQYRRMPKTIRTISGSVFSKR